MFGADQSKVRFHMHCETCDEALSYSPETDVDPFHEVEGAEDESGRAIFEIDLFRLTCGCDEFDGQVPKWSFGLVKISYF